MLSEGMIGFMLSLNHTMLTLRRSCAALIVGAAVQLALSAESAKALSVDVGLSTLTDGQICASPTVLSCLVPQFQLSSAASMSGGTLDIVGTTLTFSFSLPSASFSGSDGPVSAVALSSVIYSGSFTVSPTGSGIYEFQDQLTSISGTLTPTGAGAATAFANAAVNTTGQCSGTPGSSLVCGFLFGPVGADVVINGNARSLRQSVNIHAIPEPGTSLLMGLGLVGLAASRKARRQA